MSDAHNDPSSNTQAFQAWVDKQPAQEPAAASKTGLYVAIAVVAALLVVGVAVWLVSR